RRRSLGRICLTVVIALTIRLLFFSSSSPSYESARANQEIQQYNLIERATRGDRSLNVQKHRFLQSRIGRDEPPEIFGNIMRNGARDWWERFQLPYIMNKETAAMDAQQVVNAIDQLLSLNGWVAGLCPTLHRPFGQNHVQTTSFDALVDQDHLYYIAIIIHSADHFLVDQLAVIVQMAKRLGTSNIFVSMLDYASMDSTETLTDLCEAVLTLLGVPFRIRRVPAMTAEPQAAYYPLEEAYTRNLALEPLHELRAKRGITFKRVIWLKGFACPNDILESIKVSLANQAAMVCGMDWAEHNGFFIFSDRWRTRDIMGDQFRQSKSSANADVVPPRDKVGAERYTKHLPFQVFCCESGTHVVDPAQTYYRGIAYRAGEDYWNATTTPEQEALGTGPGPAPQRAPDAPCLDSSQAWFCRDLWIDNALEGVREIEGREGIVKMPPVDTQEAARKRARKRQGEEVAAAEEAKPEGVKVEEGVPRAAEPVDDDANAGSDFDAVADDAAEDGTGAGDWDVPLPPLSIPNSLFRPARILVNPRCPTTYAGVAHTQLARDLFGDGTDKLDGERGDGRYVLEDWEGAPESFVCQEQRTTGGRSAPKTQRRLGFSIHEALQ
ncbi:glycosyltransferase family 69 protein, partial [Fistulina hepatica ATCC 64428]